MLEPLRLGPRAVVDGYVVAALEQARGQHGAHAARPDPAKSRLIAAHPISLSCILQTFAAL
jgi:hypothetical protein